MNLESFIRTRGGAWRELETLLASARGKGERLRPEEIRRLGTLYRSAAADLALARRSFPRDPVRPAARGPRPPRRRRRLPRPRRPLLDRASSSRRTYWVRIAERPRLLAIAAGLLLAPALLAALWAINDPAGALDFIPHDFRGAIDPPRTDGNTAGQSTAFAAFLFTNNIRVTIVAFALGITAGIGTAIVLVVNGLLLGAVAGGAVEAGNGRAFLEFIIPHGPIELTLRRRLRRRRAAARLGDRRPGERAAAGRRIASEGRDAVEIVLGTMPWLVAAGISESFVRGSGLPLWALMAIGLGLFSIFWGLVWWRGFALAAAGARAERGDAAAPAGLSREAVLSPALAPGRSAAIRATSTTAGGSRCASISLDLGPRPRLRPQVRGDDGAGERVRPGPRRSRRRRRGRSRRRALRASSTSSATEARSTSRTSLGSPPSPVTAALQTPGRGRRPGSRRGGGRAPASPRPAAGPRPPRRGR